jgi:hypothetical protein
MDAITKSLRSQNPDPLKIKKANDLLSEIQASVLSIVYGKLSTVYGKCPLQ